MLGTRLGRGLRRTNVQLSTMTERTLAAYDWLNLKNFANRNSIIISRLARPKGQAPKEPHSRSRSLSKRPGTHLAYGDQRPDLLKDVIASK